MRRRHNYHVYILSNRHRTVLYTGVTGNLAERMRRHKSGKGSVFAGRYNVNRLVYVEHFRWVLDAIAREKQIKAGSRQAKLNLIERDNPNWRDLADDLGEYL